MARFLITGAAGFIGSHLVRRLRTDGHDVVAVDRRLGAPGRGGSAGPAADGGATVDPAGGFVLADLLDVDLSPLLDGVTHIVHLAGRPGVRESWSEFPAYAQGNIVTTQRLLEALRGRPGVRFVLASTSSVYGSAPMPAREDGPARPISPYGATKLAAEQICDLYGRTASLPWVALRYFTVYGPGQRPDMAFQRWLTAARDGTPILLFGDGSQVRDFTYVDDAVEATVRAALAPVNGLVINIGGGRPVAVTEALQTIEQVTGRRLLINRKPVAPGDMSVTAAATDRLAQELGFTPATPLAEGLKAQWQEIAGAGT